ncbi:MAG: methyltransferase domain-containing protein [Rhodospirillaceae bacterium]|nr:methyltransferase domain-containing protein [Rhodospirillaceae bacterium]
MGLKGLLSGARAKAVSKRGAVSDPLQSVVPDLPPPEVPHYEPGSWPVERLDVLEALWGRGNLIPGSHDFVSSLMNVGALSSAKTMLDIGSGLGGASRALVKKFGVWLVGIDRDEGLVSEANRRSLVQDMDKKAIFYACSPESLSLKPSGYDAILCRQMLSTVQNKENIFDQFCEALKPSSHLVFVDFVLGTAKDHADVLKTLEVAEMPKRHYWRPQQIANALKDRHFLIHVAEDLTEAYKTMVLTGWMAYRDSLKLAPVSGFTAEIVLDECQRWVARMSALESGAIKVYRFHATSSSEQKKGRVSTLSDWKY